MRSPIVVPNNFGDTWAMAWADDGNLYSPSDDTLGFGVPAFFTREQVQLFQSDFARFAKQLSQHQKDEFEYAPIAFNRIEGDDPRNLRGVTVNRMPDYRAQDRYRVFLDDPSRMPADWETWKSSGCAFVDGALYWAIARDYDAAAAATVRGLRQSVADASLIKSIDYGETWTRSAEENLQYPMFPGSHFSTPYFVDYGRTPVSVDGADRYVYAVSNNGVWDNGDTFILGRVQRSRIARLIGSDWEFYTGGDGLADSAWTQDVTRATPILSSPGRLGYTGASYLPGRGCYLLISWYYPAGSGFLKGASTTTMWDFYEARKPWGPWSLIGSHAWSPQGYYSPVVCPKFQSRDRIYVVTAGDFHNLWDHYHLTLVPVELL